MSNEIKHWAEQKSGYIRTLAVAGMASLALSSCGNESGIEQTPASQGTVETVTVPATPQDPPPARIKTTPVTADNNLPADDCSFRYVEPGENFSETNRDDLDEDLGLLYKLQHKGEKIKLRDVMTAGRIVKDAYEDPLYSQAIVEANDRITDGETITTDVFLNIPVSRPKQCDKHHIEKQASRRQLRQAASIGQTITRKLGTRISERASRTAESVYVTLKEEIAALKYRMDDQERQP